MQKPLGAARAPEGGNSQRKGLPRARIGRLYGCRKTVLTPKRAESRRGKDTAGIGLCIGGETKEFLESRKL